MYFIFIFAFFFCFQGVKIKMDDAGNILIRRYGKSNVYIKSTSSSTSDETVLGSEVLKSLNQGLEVDKVYKVMSKEFAKRSLVSLLIFNHFLPQNKDFRHEKVPVKC